MVRQEEYALEILQEASSNTNDASKRTEYFDGRRMHKVLPQLRAENVGIYDPVLVSIGPYHNGKPGLEQAEEYKRLVLEMFISTTGKEREEFYAPIFEHVDEIRCSYNGVSINDEVLAEMMLLDACFIIITAKVCIEDTEDLSMSHKHFRDHLGHGAIPFILADLFLLENQMPLWIIKFVTAAAFGSEDGDKLLVEFFEWVAPGDADPTMVLGKYSDSPLHLLEASHALRMVSDRTSKRKTDLNLAYRYTLHNRPFRSVTELRAKGIYFRPSSNCLKDIRFTAYGVFGVIQLPRYGVTPNSVKCLSNYIAYEMSRENQSDLPVTSYVNFMRTLLETPKDAEHLREEKILFSILNSDTEVVKVFRDIKTFEADNKNMFGDVKEEIENHCNSKAKTWIAELVHTYFRTPWTTISLIAASILLCLTFLQTYYTMKNPDKPKST